jgi:CRP/FNR family transcriptional regulator
LNDVLDLLKIKGCSTALHEDMLFQHMRFKIGQRIYLSGEPFEKLYLVRTGFLKTVLIDSSGDEQVLCFPMKGDLLGMDGIHNKTHLSEAVALSDGELVVLPYKTLTAVITRHPTLEDLVYGAMSMELVREQTMIGMLGSLSAEARVAKFLVAMADRFEKIGYSRKAYNLRMTRHEIGSYLGITLETVSRTLSALDNIGYITVDQRTISIKDEESLQCLRRLSPSQTRRSKNRVDTEAGKPQLTVIA